MNLLLLKIKNIYENLKKTEFFVALGTTGIATAIQMLVGVVINKIIAYKIGPSGVALIGQLSDFKNITTTVGTGAFSQGVTKYVAEGKNIKQLIATSLFTSIGVSVLIAIFILLFSSSLSFLIFNQGGYEYIFQVFAISLVFFSLNNILVSIINGYRKYRLLVSVKIVNSLVSLFLSGGLCWFWGLEGALIAIAINTSIVFFISYYLVDKDNRILIYLRFHLWDRQVLLKLLGFTVMALTGALLKPLVQMYLRGYIIDHGGENIAGIWEAMKRLSDYYCQVFTLSLGVYYLPKLSSLKSNSEIRFEIYAGMKKIIPFFLIVAAGIFIFRYWIVSLLFSEEFLSMENLFIPQLIGDLLMLLSFMLAYLMLAKAMVKVFVILQVLMASIRIFLSIYLYNLISIEGVVWANAINYTIYLLLLCIIFRKVLFHK